MLLNVLMDVVTGFFTGVLQSMVSPLEVSACIVLAGAGEPECNRGQLVLAAVVLCLASCDWHVPLVTPYHNKVCRLLSAMCMHALHPTSPAMISWVVADPTFGKRPPTATSPSSGITDPVALEHIRSSEEEKVAVRQKISLQDAIEKLKNQGDADEQASKILAAATSLRDAVCRARKTALRQMAAHWNVLRQSTGDGT